MKKLMIVASAVMMACAVNAASYVWGFSNYDTVAPDGAYFGDGSYADATALLYLGTVTAGTEGWSGLDSATLLASANMDPVNFNWGNFDTSAMNTSDAVNANGGQAYTLILVDSANVTDLASYDGKYVSVAGTSVGSSIPGAGETVFFAKFTSDVAFGAADWADVPSGGGGGGGGTGDVPEPTSGLLLLLGVAGLALKRKVA